MTTDAPTEKTPITKGEDPILLQCEDGQKRQFNGLNIHPQTICSAIDALEDPKETRLGDLVDERKTLTKFNNKFFESPFYTFLAALIDVHPRSNPNHNKIGIIVPTNSSWVPEYTTIGDDTFNKNSVYIPANQTVITPREIAVESQIVDKHYVVTTASDHQYKLKQDSVALKVLPDSFIKELLEDEYSTELLTRLV